MSIMTTGALVLVVCEKYYDGEGWTSDLQKAKLYRCVNEVLTDALFGNARTVSGSLAGLKAEIHACRPGKLRISSISYGIRGVGNEDLGA